MNHILSVALLALLFGDGPVRAEDHQTYAHAVARPVDVHNVEITGGFWKQRIDQAVEHGLPRLYTQYEERPIVKNFLPGRKHEGARNQDEFLYKALEAGAWLLDDNPPASLRRQYTRIRDIVIARQASDGFLNTKTQSGAGIEPFGPESWMDYYFAGHLMQAGIAELRTTGEKTLYRAAKAYVDLLIKTYTEGGMEMRFFGNAPGQWPDHPDFETAIVELYRVTGDPKYLDFCKRIIDFSKYTERTFLRHHSVQEMLFHTGVADYYLERGDKPVWRTLNILWQDLQRQMYVTGAVGSFQSRERFAKAYDLTNQRAYAETCASIANMFWNWKMFLATGEAKYVDVMERALYNGILVSPAVNGHEYFYVCPLEVRKYRQRDGYNPTSTTFDGKMSHHWYWDVRRLEYQNCSCCPPNVQRLLASLEQYVYAADQDTVWVNLFAASRMNHELPGGAKLTLTQVTDFPVSGDLELRVELDRPARFTLKVRVPEWTLHTGRKIAVNGSPVPLESRAGYFAEISREWKTGDEVTVSYGMPVRFVRSHPRNSHNASKVVLARGPVVYCIEGADYPGIDIFDIRLDLNAEFTSQFMPELLNGVVLVKGKGFVVDAAGWEQRPYRDYEPWRESEMKAVEITAVPYYAWANRGYDSMLTAIPFID